MRNRDVVAPFAGWLLLSLIACTGQSHVSPAPAPSAPGDVLRVADSALRRPLVFIVYGDMRFTDTRETQASNPGPRQALVAGIAAQRPDALFLTGDVPWHGGRLGERAPDGR